MYSVLWSRVRSFLCSWGVRGLTRSPFLSPPSISSSVGCVVAFTTPTHMLVHPPHKQGKHTHGTPLPLLSREAEGGRKVLTQMWA